MDASRPARAVGNRACGVMQRLEETRGELVNELTQHTGGDATVAAGLRIRIAEMDRRTADVDQQLAQADAVVSQAAAVPGAIVQHHDVVQTGPDEDAVALGLVLARAERRRDIVCHA